MLRAMGHITPSHMMDRNLYPFTSIKPTGTPDPAGDKAFDDDDEDSGDDCGTPTASATPKAQPIRILRD
jgi:tRNA 2-thiocytidine biosynthesis protein TtcA